MKKFFDSMFSREEINTGRQIEIDIAKAVCIIGMIFVHAFEELPHIAESGIGGEFILLKVFNTIFGATTFMFCMGVGMSYTNKNSPELFMKRGVIIFVIGIILNFFRFTLVQLIINGVNPGYYSYNDIIEQLMQIDILYFAGLAMILFGFLKKIKVPLWGIVALAITMSILGTIFNGYHLDNVWLNSFCGWFIGMVDETYNDTTSFFPLLNWFIIVVVGYCFALALKRVKNKNRFYLLFSSIGLVAVVLYCVFGIPAKIGVFGSSYISTYHIKIYDVIISNCGAIFAFGLYYFLSKILPKFLLKGAYSMSKYINTIYCIQWLFYGNFGQSSQYLGMQFTAVHIALIAIGVTVGSVFMAWLYKSVLPKYIKKRKEQTT